MLFRSLKVKPAHRMIVLQDDRIRTVLPSGSHWLWHGMQDIHTFSENISDLNVVWDGMAAALRFERDTVARYWRIIDSAPGSVTVVWHRYMAAQVVGSGLDGRKPDRIAFERAGNLGKSDRKNRQNLRFRRPRRRIERLDQYSNHAAEIRLP